MNPNLWGINAAAGTKCIIANIPDQTVKQPPAVVTATDTTLHCYALANVTTGSTWTRVRTLTLAAYDAATTTAKIATGTNLYWHFVWEGFVTLQNYSGSCIKADTSVPDYYGAFYTLDATVTAAPTATPTADVGELGATAMVGAGSDGFNLKVFFSAPIFAPATSTTTVFTGNYANTSNKVWLSSYGDAAVNSNNGLTFLRVRWTPATADPMAPNGKIAIFYK